MTLKITLITPPDIFENENNGILLANLTEQEQSLATEWLGKFESEQSYNIYFYQNETDVPWFLHAMANSKYKYITLNEFSGVTHLLAGYILSKNNTYYSTNDPNVASVFGYINSCRVSSVTDFFERTLGAKEQQPS
jgi:hypothetical protein